MRTELRMAYQFVEFIPAELEEETLYISVEYATASHKCCCGCGREVVTPLSPTDWRLTFDGQTITLFPSIGNWSFECQSHYWIKNGRVEWAGQWSREQVAAGRAHDARAKARYYQDASEAASAAAAALEGLWARVKAWFSHLIS